MGFRTAEGNERFDAYVEMKNVNVHFPAEQTSVWHMQQ